MNISDNFELLIHYHESNFFQQTKEKEKLTITVAELRSLLDDAYAQLQSYKEVSILISFIYLLHQSETMKNGFKITDFLLEKHEVFVF